VATDGHAVGDEPRADSWGSVAIGSLKQILIRIDCAPCTTEFGRCAEVWTRRAGAHWCDHHATYPVAIPGRDGQVANLHRRPDRRLIPDPQFGTRLPAILPSGRCAGQTQTGDSSATRSDRTVDRSPQRSAAQRQTSARSLPSPRIRSACASCARPAPRLCLFLVVIATEPSCPHRVRQDSHSRWINQSGSAQGVTLGLW
jgi:hypothetical protein